MIKKHHYSKNKYCKCGKLISDCATRCKSCSHKKPRDEIINKKLLNQLYWDKKYPLKTIGKILNLNSTTVFYWMKKLGIPRRKGNQMQKGLFGELSQAWKSGRLNKNGYIIVYRPNHPFASKSGYILEHRLVIEKHIKRYLTKKEIIHHINGIRTDNRIKNLVITNKNKHEKHTLIKIFQERIKYLELKIWKANN